MNTATDVIYKRVAAAPGKMNAVDVINAVRSASIPEPAIRRGIWRLVGEGVLELDPDLHLKPSGVALG